MYLLMIHESSILKETERVRGLSLSPINHYTSQKDTGDWLASSKYMGTRLTRGLLNIFREMIFYEFIMIRRDGDNETNLQIIDDIYRIC